MTERKTERRGLGRGLSALMADIGADVVENAAAAQTNPTGSFRLVPIEWVHPNRNQPRRHFDDAALDDLANSIREKGIVQPLVVREHATTANHLEIVAGERRWRAAQRAQIAEVPVVVRAFNDQEVLEVAIIENIQREDLNPIEEATGYRQLIDRFGHTQEKVAEALGKSRSHIANLLRLLALPPEVQAMVVNGALSAGHARALITAANPQALAESVIARGLSVRETEKLARDAIDTTRKGRKPSAQKDADTRELEDNLSANLGMSVVIDHRVGGEGQVIIRYKTIDQLDQLCQVLSSVY